jgi:hypothetical protein
VIFAVVRGFLPGARKTPAYTGHVRPHAAQTSGFLLFEADDQPRSLRDPAARERRRAMLGLPHMIELASYAKRLRRPGVEVPDFDPLDGGIDAPLLFLFEKPGPMTTETGNGQRSGSGFISRDNDDPTAEAVFNFMRQADIPRELTILWNVIPWWNGTRAVERLELQDGARRVFELIHLLRQPRAVVLVGSKAAEARSYLPIAGLPVFTSSHPSPLVRARWPDRWKAIPSEWRKVKTVL